MDTKIVAKYAIESLCAGVFFVHNHPSGNVKPSMEDKLITDKLKKALSLFDIKLVDSVIISDGSFFSFAMKVYYSSDNEIKYILVYLFFK